MVSVLVVRALKSLVEVPVQSVSLRCAAAPAGTAAGVARVVVVLVVAAASVRRGVQICGSNVMGSVL